MSRSPQKLSQTFGYNRCFRFTFGPFNTSFEILSPIPDVAYKARNKATKEESFSFPKEVQRESAEDPKYSFRRKMTQKWKIRSIPHNVIMVHWQKMVQGPFPDCCVVIMDRCLPVEISITQNCLAASQQRKKAHTHTHSLAHCVRASRSLRCCLSSRCDSTHKAAEQHSLLSSNRKSSYSCCSTE